MFRKLCYSLFFVFLLALTVSLNAQVDPSEFLIHSYTFDDGTANDEVGGAHGTLVGDAAIDNGALVTSAQDQWMEMPSQDMAIYIYEEVTMAAWYTPDSGANTGWSMLAFFGDTLSGLGSNGWFMTTARADDKSRAAISCLDVATPWLSETGVDGPEYDDGLLHHMVSTLNSTDITLSIDGELMGSAALAADNQIYNISPNVAYLAKGGYAGDPEWIGDIHDFKVFNKALSEEEVLWLYQNGPISAIDENEIATLPKEYSLSQNYPNPFNPTTNISFNLPKKSEVKIIVYDVLGQEVVTLLDEFKSAGQHIVQFDGKNLRSGLYFCRMNIGNQVFTRKMTLIK